MSAPRVFLDACVLYPPLVRGVLLETAANGLYAPLWSARVLAEWRIAAARNEGPMGETAALAAEARMRAHFPDAEVPAAPEGEALLRLPDPADAHVLAAAAAARADILLTFNLRDFPVGLVRREGAEPRHPDGFLWELASDAPARFARLLAPVLPDGDPRTRRNALKRARLPRLGKLLEPAFPAA
ncbi:MAG: RSP_2648 family PIN domain-containing protein [Paracoccaceae bacterium]